MLEVENGQLAINQAAYENLVAVQLMELKAKLSNAAAAEIEELAKQKAEEATNNNASASNNAVRSFLQILLLPHMLVGSCLQAFFQNHCLYQFLHQIKCYSHTS